VFSSLEEVAVILEDLEPDDQITQYLKSILQEEGVEML